LTTIELDRASYVATPLAGPGGAGSYGFTVIARYENRTGQPVYLAQCGAPGGPPIYSIPVAGDTGWSAYNPVWACFPVPPTVLIAGSVRIDTLTMRGPTAFNGAEPIGVLAGTFRLVYATRACTQDTPTCYQSGALIESPGFRVRVP
jgi:hypothetical protein